MRMGSNSRSEARRSNLRNALGDSVSQSGIVVTIDRNVPAKGERGLIRHRVPKYHVRRHVNYLRWKPTERDHTRRGRERNAIAGARDRCSRWKEEWNKRRPRLREGRREQAVMRERIKCWRILRWERVCHVFEQRLLLVRQAAAQSDKHQYRLSIHLFNEKKKKNVGF